MSLLPEGFSSAEGRPFRPTTPDQAAEAILRVHGVDRSYKDGQTLIDHTWSDALCMNHYRLTKQIDHDQPLHLQVQLTLEVEQHPDIEQSVRYTLRPWDGHIVSHDLQGVPHPTQPHRAQQTNDMLQHLVTVPDIEDVVKAVKPQQKQQKQPKQQRVQRPPKSRGEHDVLPDRETVIDHERQQFWGIVIASAFADNPEAGKRLEEYRQAGNPMTRMHRLTILTRALHSYDDFIGRKEVKDWLRDQP